MSKVRVCFLGTPQFAVTALEQLLKDEHYEVVGVVTQPDRPAGRKLQLTPSPVKRLALSHHLRVIAPEKINIDVILQEIAKWGAEVAVVVAYGQILSTKFLSLFPYGAVNIHGSVLPRWRGAAPIQRALEAGDEESGVTLQKIVKELDAGEILGIRKIPLDQNINALELHDKMAALGADLLHVELMDYIRGNLGPIPQDPAGVTYAKKIEKAECQINWNDSAVTVHNRVRGFLLGPGCSTTLQGKRVKLYETRLASLAAAPSAQMPASPGSVISADENGIFVQTGSGVLELLELQPESRNRMKASDFIRGTELKKGDRFGV